MKTVQEFLMLIGDENKAKILSDLFSWILEKYPSLELKIAWNQPMFTDHKTFIIGFSVAKEHFSIAPELFTMQKFEQEIKDAGYGYSKMLFKIKWNENINYSLLSKIIEFNILDKKEYSKFWR